jgi:hypothetical protein
VIVCSVSMAVSGMCCTHGRGGYRLHSDVFMVNDHFMIHSHCTLTNTFFSRPSVIPYPNSLTAQFHDQIDQKQPNPIQLTASTTTMKVTTTFLLLALLAMSLLPTAQACLYYQAYYYDRDRYYQGYLTDNGVEVCKRVGYQSTSFSSPLLLPTSPSQPPLTTHPQATTPTPKTLSPASPATTPGSPPTTRSSTTRATTRISNSMGSRSGVGT